MLPDRVSNPGPLTYESGAVPIALRGPASRLGMASNKSVVRLTDRPDMTLDVYRGRKTTMQQLVCGRPTVTLGFALLHQTKQIQIITLQTRTNHSKTLNMYFTYFSNSFIIKHDRQQSGLPTLALSSSLVPQVLSFSVCVEDT